MGIGEVACAANQIAEEAATMNREKHLRINAARVSDAQLNAYRETSGVRMALQSNLVIKIP